MKEMMNKMNQKWDIKVIVMIIIVAAMTGVGVYRMEYDWCEWMTGVIWLVGEAMIVSTLAFKPMMKFIMDETKKVYERMLED
jgi:hypothetical protein